MMPVSKIEQTIFLETSTFFKSVLGPGPERQKGIGPLCPWPGLPH